MRTPGNDFELAAGFLIGVRDCLDRELRLEQRYNVVTVELTAAVSAT